MLKNEFAAGLLKETPEAMAAQLAMWDSMKLWNVMWKKASGWRQKQDLLRQQIDSESKHIQRLWTVNEMRLQILFKLADHMELTLPRNLTAGDLDNLGERIIFESIMLLRNTDKHFKGSNSKEMASHVLRKMFEDLSKRFDEQDSETQKKIVEAIMQGIKTMPEDQRDRLRKELNVDELTNEAVRKAIITGSLGTAFAVVIEVSGFSAYIFAVKLLAGITGLIGITLPFAAYTALTSMMAFLSNPLLLGPAFLISGWLLTKRGNSKIKNGLAPVLVTLAIVSSALDSSEESSVKEFILLYNEKIKLRFAESAE